MSSDAASTSSGSILLEANRFYRALTQTQGNAYSEDPETETNLGGSLFYVGELDARGSALAVAGNVAGCATLGATADPAAQKQAIRNGTVDFVVTSLDEALRILKNEIRKRSTVAVCVGLAPSDVEREMVERGVLPDLVAVEFADEHRDAPQFGVGSQEVRLNRPDRTHAFLEWQVAQDAFRWMAKLDEIAIECLPSDTWARRWIRRSPRYFGRSAQGQRVLNCDPELAARIVEGFDAAVRDGAIQTEVSGSLMIGEERDVFRFSPPGAA